MYTFNFRYIRNVLYLVPRQDLGLYSISLLATRPKYLNSLLPNEHVLPYIILQNLFLEKNLYCVLIHNTVRQGLASSLSWSTL